MVQTQGHVAHLMRINKPQWSIWNTHVWRMVQWHYFFNALLNCIKSKLAFLGKAWIEEKRVVWKSQVFKLEQVPKKLHKSQLPQLMAPLGQTSRNLRSFVNTNSYRIYSNPRYTWRCLEWRGSNSLPPLASLFSLRRQEQRIPEKLSVTRKNGKWKLH